MGDDLVAEEIEVDPLVRAAPFRAAEQPAVKGARRGKVVDRERRDGRAPLRLPSAKSAAAGAAACGGPWRTRGAPACRGPLSVIPSRGDKGSGGVKRGFGTLLLGAALVAGCVAPAPRASRMAPPVAPPPAPSYSTHGLESVIGRGVRAIVALFGNPDLDVREGSARKLQFAGPACVLDAYLYPPRGGADAIATHVDARLPDGRDMDRSSCVAALSRRLEAR